MHTRRGRWWYTWTFVRDHRLVRAHTRQTHTTRCTASRCCQRRWQVSRCISVSRNPTTTPEKPSMALECRSHCSLRLHGLFRPPHKGQPLYTQHVVRATAHTACPVLTLSIFLLDITIEHGAVHSTNTCNKITILGGDTHKKLPDGRCLRLAMSGSCCRSSHRNTVCNVKKYDCKATRDCTAPTTSFCDRKHDDKWSSKHVPPQRMSRGSFVTI